MASPICTYLHDHLAGSVVIGEMLSKALGACEVPDREFLERLDREIAEERGQLEALCKTLGPRESLIKRTAAWTSEKIARFKVGASDDPLRHLEFLDTLLAGVRGKLGLWQVLAAVPSTSSSFASLLDLPALIASAEAQIAGINTCRIEAFDRLLQAEESSRNG